MSKKRDFESTFLNISREEEMGNRGETNSMDVVVFQSEQKNNKSVSYIQSEDELMKTFRQNLEYIKQKITSTEEMIKLEQSRRFKARNKKRKYSEKYCGVTLSIRTEILNIIEELRETLTMNKYEIIETLLINGLKYTNFEEL